MSRREIKGLAISASVCMDRARSKHIPGLCISCSPAVFRPQKNPGNQQLGASEQVPRKRPNKPAVRVPVTPYKICPPGQRRHKLSITWHHWTENGRTRQHNISKAGGDAVLGGIGECPADDGSVEPASKPLAGGTRIAADQFVGQRLHHPRNRHANAHQIPTAILTRTDSPMTLELINPETLHAPPATPIPSSRPHTRWCSVHRRPENPKTPRAPLVGAGRPGPPGVRQPRPALAAAGARPGQIAKITIYVVHHRARAPAGDRAGPRGPGR
jgi:hypothetical protein